MKLGERLFVVTNKHNFFLSFAHQKYIGYKLDGIRIVGYFGLERYAECDFVGQSISFATPENNAEDLVVFEVTNVPFRFVRERAVNEDASIKTTQLSPINIDITMLATDDDLKALNPGDPIAFPSYPELFDANGIRPLMRSGTIASDPMSDYRSIDQEPARRIVFESHSTQGSSGGPVFSMKQSEVVLLGINAGHLTANETKLGPIHSGFSYCFKANCILDAIGRIQRA